MWKKGGLVETRIAGVDAHRWNKTNLMKYPGNRQEKID